MSITCNLCRPSSLEKRDRAVEGEMSLKRNRRQRSRSRSPYGAQERVQRPAVAPRSHTDAPVGTRFSDVAAAAHSSGDAGGTARCVDGGIIVDASGGGIKLGRYAMVTGLLE